MAKRADIFSEEHLGLLYLHHPYLLLLQKEDWKEYLILIAQLYDLLEEENVKIPYEVIRSFIIKFYGQRKPINLENKIHQFLTMAIGELQILKDSHDQFGQRFFEVTRFGKILLQLVENLLTQRTKFSGTGAETLLGALNDILASRQTLTEAEAIQHHKEKIKAYQRDLELIKDGGLSRAELLPIPHSNEALFNQAEEAAIHILASIEDVKASIEGQRQELAQTYFDSSRSAGHSLSAVAEFYERLYATNEYTSYNQAKLLLSYLDGFAARFPVKNVDHLLHKINKNELISKDQLQKSSLQGFMSQFQNADQSIQEKVKAQVKLLQQQVHYAMSTDIQGSQAALREVAATMLASKERVASFFDDQPVTVEFPVEFDIGPVEIFAFEIPPEIESIALQEMPLGDAEQRALFLALLQAEEATLKMILNRLRMILERDGRVSLREYSLENGLAEYYVLSEINVFDEQIVKAPDGSADLIVTTKFGDFVLRGAPAFNYSLTENYGA